jgi:hypothetical protein
MRVSVLFSKSEEITATRSMSADPRKQQIPPLPLRLASLAQGPVGMTNYVNSLQRREIQSVVENGVGKFCTDAGCAVRAKESVE